MKLIWSQLSPEAKEEAIAVYAAKAVLVSCEPEMTHNPVLTCRWYEGQFLLTEWSQPEPPDGKWWHDWRESDFLTDANRVLPLLYARHWEVNQTSHTHKPIRVRLDDAYGPFGEAATFQEAACIALLRASGVEVDV